MRYWTLAIPILLILLLAGVASGDRDPLCKDLTLAAQTPTVDATGGTVYFCSPSHGATLVPYPDPPGGPLMNCVISVSGVVVATITDVWPEQLITHTDPALRFGHPVDIVCSNAAGDGGLDVNVIALFPPDAPGGSHVLSGP